MKMDIRVSYSNGVHENYDSVIDFGFNTDNPKFLFIVLEKDPENAILINEDHIRKIKVDGQ